jgi:mRNA interferase RelE/StbE
MRFSLAWTAKAATDLERLPRVAAKRIKEKMEWYAAQEDPLSFAKRLAGTDLGTYRFRIGNYRVLCDVENGKVSVLIVLSVKDRRHAYKA